MDIVCFTIHMTMINCNWYYWCYFKWQQEHFCGATL